MIPTPDQWVYVDLIKRAVASQHKLTWIQPSYVCALVTIESGWDPTAVSGSSIGLMQVEPGTASDVASAYGLTDLGPQTDPYSSLLTGICYFDLCARKILVARGTKSLLLTDVAEAYNAGYSGFLAGNGNPRYGAKMLAQQIIWSPLVDSTAPPVVPPPPPPPPPKTSVGTLPSESRGGDSDAVCNAATAEALAASGCKFLLRYISRKTPQNPGDLSITERLTILRAGIAVGYVQHYPGDGWAPSAANGSSLGVAAVANLVAIGASPGAIIWRDWEGLDLASSLADALADIGAWCQQVRAGGFDPGMYIGYDCIFDSSDLARIDCTHFWSSASTVPILASGYQMIQTLGGSPVPGYDWDCDVVLQDAIGGLPIFDLPG